MRRIKRRPNTDRPMLKGDAAERVKTLMNERAPVYGEADITVISREVPHDTIVDEIVAELAKRLEIPAAERGA
jgi:shikimate kinase